MDNDLSVKYEFVSFFRSRWSAIMKEGDSYVILNPLSQVTDQENREQTMTMSV